MFLVEQYLMKITHVICYSSVLFFSMAAQYFKVWTNHILIILSPVNVHLFQLGFYDTMNKDAIQVPLKMSLHTGALLCVG